MDEIQPGEDGQLKWVKFSIALCILLRKYFIVFIGSIANL